MSIKDRIKKELEIQKQIEGEDCQDEILLEFLDAITIESQWLAFVTIEFYPYGKLSYETHRFYYPKPELIKLIGY